MNKTENQAGELLFGTLALKSVYPSYRSHLTPKIAAFTPAAVYVSWRHLYYQQNSTL